MIKTLENFEIGDFLSDSLKKDDNIDALAYALTPIFQDIFSKTQLIKMFGGVPDHLLDFVAFEEAAEFYDVNMTNEQKRILIANAENIHKTKGTVAAVESVIAPFFSKGRVSEWFKYGGEPYHFLIHTNEYLQNELDIAKVFRMVHKVKRQSTRLERVFFYRKDGIPLQAVEADKNILIHPMLGNFFCGQWEVPSTLGRIIDGGITIKSESLDKSISNYKLTNRFFVNSDEGPQIVQKEFAEVLQILQQPVDYSYVNFLFASNNLMIGRMITGKTDIVNPIQNESSTDITIQNKMDTSLQALLSRSGQYFVGSKGEIQYIQKQFGSAVSIEQQPLDYSNVDYLMANDSLIVGQFRTGKKETIAPVQRNVSSNELTLSGDSYVSFQEELSRAGQFFIGSKEALKTIQKEYQQAINASSQKDLSFVEYIATRADLKLNFLVGSKEVVEQYTTSTNSNVSTKNTSDKTTSNYRITGQFYAGQG
ncbi:phage tail protein I [Niallia taxi]|uniref:phage tail protein I n=1 Tax=Niallia taxi TaxID=2499688 RepID=UPI003F63693A